jgi:hypothetical protein
MLVWIDDYKIDKSVCENCLNAYDCDERNVCNDMRIENGFSIDPTKVVGVSSVDNPKYEHKAYVSMYEECDDVFVYSKTAKEVTDIINEALSKDNEIVSFVDDSGCKHNIVRSGLIAMYSDNQDPDGKTWIELKGISSYLIVLPIHQVVEIFKGDN